MTTYSLCKIKYLANTDHEYRDFGVITMYQKKFRVCIENDEEKYQVVNNKMYGVFKYYIWNVWSLI